ncbi:TIM barrel protein [Actinomycetospora sp. TBRC 11914]|uniref:TIM barrel protein n=1 Tax=Actinomycetospora sp. TBRC 11914 TaxID=2729387 RepID=UPI00145D8248|nr:TIM barrel protein [Actinomycetospora sp. TBRC 11914]NMO94106.1 TIM barrel protein [Actinomycetospora sp. TBRC 11914]
MSRAANVSILYPDVPVLERPARARDDGFAAIESWWPFATAGPSDAEVDAFVAAVADAGLELVAMNTFGGDLGAGERGIASDPRRKPEFDDSLAVALEVGHRLGTRLFNTLVGIGPLRDLAADRLALAAKAAQREGRRILVEPLSGIDDYPITTARDAFALVGALGSGGAGVLGDLYHLAVNGEDVDALIATRGQDLAHVQIADAPGRGAPGTGSLPLDRWTEALDRVGYAGWVALEHLPS